MTIEQIVCVMFGSILQATVFALGVAVGVSLSKRKDSQNDSDSDESAQSRRCDDGQAAVTRRVERRGGGGCDPRAEADPVERFASRRSDHGDRP
jgi:hypothetical protein